MGRRGYVPPLMLDEYHGLMEMKLLSHMMNFLLIIYLAKSVILLM
jgi:hypothetical protein